MEVFEKEKLKIAVINKMMKEPKKLLNGLFSIGFDTSEDKEHCCLVVAHFRGATELMIINTLYDEEANELLKKICGYEEKSGEI